LEEDKNYRKLHYIRYADDFLLGFIGPKKEAHKILCEIANILGQSLKLNLNVDKSSVVHHKKGVMFLGYKIWGNYGLNVKWNEERGQRVGGTTLKFSIPLKKLFERFSERGFFQLAKKGKQRKFVGRRQDK